MKFKKGDKVTHKCGSPRGEMHATFSHYIDHTKDKAISTEPRVAVIYRTTEKWGKKGDWLEKYCISRSPLEFKVKPKSPKEQGKLMPKINDFKLKSDGSPSLLYLQVLYAWRGYNGLHNYYSPDKYYAWEKEKSSSKEPRIFSVGDSVCRINYSAEKAVVTKICPQKEGEPNSIIVNYPDGTFSDWYECNTKHAKKTSHITDPVANGPMEILTDLQKQVRDNMANVSPTMRNKTFFDEIDWESIPKFDTAQDAARYMSIDWAKGYEPKTKPENEMKAIITEVYVDGVLTETKINDRNVDDMEPGELLGQISSANTAIEKLTKHDGSKCKFIGQEMKRLTGFIDSVYVLLDQKAGNQPKG